MYATRDRKQGGSPKWSLNEWMKIICFSIQILLLPFYLPLSLCSLTFYINIDLGDLPCFFLYHRLVFLSVIMEQEKCKEGRQTTLPYRSEKIRVHTEEHIVASTQRKNNDDIKHHDSSFASPTPEKIIQPPRSRKSKEHSYQFRQEEDALEMTSDRGDDHALRIETSQSGGSKDASDVKNNEQRSPFPSELLKEKTMQLSEK